MFDLSSVTVTNERAAAPPSSPDDGETIEHLYVYPNGFFPDRRREPEVGDVIVSNTANPADAGLTPSKVLGVAAEDGDDLIILKVTRFGGFIAKVEFVAAVSGSGKDA